jgi:hypothetical protein
MTAKEMDYTAKGMKPFYDPKLIILGELNNEPVGLTLAVPNINEVLKKMNGDDGPIGLLKFLYYKRKIKGCRSLLGGCLKEHRQSGLIAHLFYETVIQAANHYEWCEMSWNLEHNTLINKFDEDIGGKLYKKYRLYQKSI